MNIIEAFKVTRNLTNSLCKPLKIEDYTPQSADFASPPKWHLAHTTWFFEQMILKPFVKDYEVFDSEFSFLFNSYYNTMGKRIASHERGLITRPSVDGVYEYRAYVDKHIEKLLSVSQLDKAVNDLVILGVNHEQQHQELLITDIKYTLSRNPIHPKLYEISYANTLQEIEALEFIDVGEGVYTIGSHKNEFCYDNELGHHRVFLENYAIANRLVTNREYIAFIEAKGYSTSKYWLDDGWCFVNSNNIKHPLYWEQEDHAWYVYTLAGRVLLNLDAPVTHISFYEAHAYANFKNKRLATEFEWEVANAQFHWGKTWEWTNSAYLPYPNYKQDEGAVGEYNGKFMINLMVLKGSSVATSPNHSRPTYRNFFSPETRWQFSGIRLAK
jgi:ergothioneine biosynthesis protein EgtB